MNTFSAVAMTIIPLTFVNVGTDAQETWDESCRVQEQTHNHTPSMFTHPQHM